MVADPAKAALITTGAGPVVASFSLDVLGQPEDLTATLTFSNFVVSGNTASMTVQVQNTTNAAFPSARLTGFGFDTNPNPTGISEDSSVYISGPIDGNVPGGIGSIDVCLISSVQGNNCSGGSNGGLSSGQSNSFGLTLTFSAPLTSFLLGQNSASDPDFFYARFQTAVGSYTFGNTPPTGVPEPASLAILGAGLLGLGIAGRARRRRT